MRDISYSYFLSKHRLKKIINIEDAENLTNDTYLSFAEQYHKIENIENWLRRVLFLTFIRWHKEHHKFNSIELNDNYIGHNDNKPTSDQIDLETILKEIDTLSDEKQKIIRLRFWGELKFKEIADAMDKTEVAVKKMFYRALADLKNKIE